MDIQNIFQFELKFWNINIAMQMKIYLHCTFVLSAAKTNEIKSTTIWNWFAFFCLPLDNTIFFNFWNFFWFETYVQHRANVRSANIHTYVYMYVYYISI